MEKTSIGKEYRFDLFLSAALEWLCVLSEMIWFTAAVYCIASLIKGRTSPPTGAVSVVPVVFLYPLLLKYRTKKRLIFANGLKTDIRRRLMQSVFMRGVHFTEQYHSARLGIETWMNVEWIGIRYTDSLPKLIAAAGLFVPVCIGAFFFCRTAAALCAGAVLWFLLFNALIKPLVQKHNSAAFEADEIFSTLCLDGLRGTVTLKSLNAVPYFRRRLERQAEAVQKSSMKEVLSTGVQRCFSELGLYLSAFFALYQLMTVNGGDRAALPAGITLCALLYFVLTLVRNGSGLFLQASKGRIAEKTVCGLLLPKTELKEAFKPPAEQNRAAADYVQGIRLEQVCFRYPESTSEALKNICIEIPHGGKIGLVGYSGSGKSTILQLLSGFYAPSEGSVRVFGKTLSKENRPHFRSMCSAVWQKTHLFSDTCLNNIRIAEPQAKAEAVIAAAEKAGIHETIINLPQGYDTLIGDGGHELSGGEAQRIAIARAFLRNAPLLLLDEATAFLDRRNEQLVEQSLKELMADKTVVAVAHRLETVRNADCIYVFDNGAVAACGRHDELLRTSSLYRELWQLQTAEHKNEEGD